VLNTHLDASGDDRWRRQEAARLALMATMISAGSPRLLVGGDLNAEPDTPTLELLTAVPLRDGWRVCGGADDGLSYPAASPIKRIDYLLFPPAIICQSAEVLASDASDHRPVLFSALIPKEQ
jgi:endonuclease/exonuclease/phosphatase family metal-dependent hydrolase